MWKIYILNNGEKLSEDSQTSKHLPIKFLRLTIRLT